jgi:hypothetical protein
VDPTVAEVVTGGHWSSGGQSGFYRVIVRTGGFEHIVSRLTIEWLIEPTRDDPPRVMRSVQVPELSGIARLDRPRIGQFLKGWRVWVQLTDTHSESGKQINRSIDLGPPGEIKVVRAP